MAWSKFLYIYIYIYILMYIYIYIYIYIYSFLHTHVYVSHERCSLPHYSVSFMSEFHEVKCPDHNGRVAGNG